MDFNAFLTQKLLEPEFSPSGSYYLDQATTVIPKVAKPEDESLTYPTASVIGKPTQYEIDTNNLTTTTVKTGTKSIPITKIATNLKVPYDLFNGGFLDDTITMDRVMNEVFDYFALEMQDKAERGFTTSNLETVGYLNDSRILKQDVQEPDGTAFVLASLKLETQEDANKFRRWLTDTSLKVDLISKGKFQSNVMIIPIEVRGLFKTPIPYSGGVGQSAHDYMAGQGISCVYSRNARSFASGRIVMAKKEEIETIVTLPLEALFDQQNRHGMNVNTPVRTHFAGSHIYQPLSAFYFDHVIS